MVLFEPFYGFARVVRRTEKGTRQLSSVLGDIGLRSSACYYFSLVIKIRLLRRSNCMYLVILYCQLFSRPKLDIF
jgi:hypothetical protein